VVSCARSSYDELHRKLTGIFLINENSNKCSAQDNKLWEDGRESVRSRSLQRQVLPPMTYAAKTHQLLTNHDESISWGSREGDQLIQWILLNAFEGHLVTLSEPKVKSAAVSLRDDFYLCS
jgi:hypothetical protein